jgi:hypothetical protein
MCLNSIVEVRRYLVRSSSIRSKVELLTSQVHVLSTAEMNGFLLWYLVHNMQRVVRFEVLSAVVMKFPTF